MRERILGLVQYWADAFKGKPQLTAVEELYEQLKGEGVEFPPVDLDALAPVETPQRVCVCAEICSSFMSRPGKTWASDPCDHPTHASLLCNLIQC